MDHNTRYGVDVYARHEEIPEGWTEYVPGEECPFGANEYVSLLIKTPEGYGPTAAMKAQFHDWPNLPEEVVAYRVLKIVEPKKRKSIK